MDSISGADFRHDNLPPDFLESHAQKWCLREN